MELHETAGTWNEQAVATGMREAVEKVMADYGAGVPVSSLRDVRESEFTRADAESAFARSGQSEGRRPEWIETYTFAYARVYYRIYTKVQQALARLDEALRAVPGDEPTSVLEGLYPDGGEPDTDVQAYLTFMEDEICYYLMRRPLTEREQAIYVALVACARALWYAGVRTTESLALLAKIQGQEERIERGGGC